MIGNTVSLDVGKSLRPRRLDIDRRPRSAQMVRYTSSVTDQPGSAWYFADADEDPFAGWPGAGDRMRAHMREQLLIDPLSRPAQRELAQRGQVPLRKIVPDRALGLMRDIDFTFPQALD